MQVKERTKAYIFGGMFLGMLILPRLLFPFLKDYVDTENYENRVYQERPSLDFSMPLAGQLKAFPGQYEAYFNDHLAFKNPIVAFGKLSDIYVFGEVTSDAVLVGKEGWLFYKLKNEKEDSIADYQGTNQYSKEEMERFASLLKQAEDHLAKQGIQLILYMVPNKEQVYREYMPSSVKVVNERSKADLLYTYVKEHTDCSMYYPLEEFLEAKTSWHQIYRKYDTHWNDLGAFLASQMIMAKIDGEEFGPWSYEGIKVEDHGTFSGDLATMLNLQKYYDDDPFLKPGGYKEEVMVELDYQNERETVTHYRSSASKKAEKLLVCRDSFGVHMAEYFAKNYPDVTMLDYRTEDCAAWVQQEKPDVVVIEAAERYSDYMFGLLEALGSISF